jgi:hypothetical protein
MVCVGGKRDGHATNTPMSTCWWTWKTDSRQKEEDRGLRIMN